jgi:putative transposase
MCSVLEVSRSGYYSWSSRRKSQREQQNESLRDEIKRVFFESKRRYGSPRVYRQLKYEGVVCGRHRVAKLMRREELVARKKRKYLRVLSERHYRAQAQNVLNREFAVKEPNKVWASDVSYFWTQKGWIHLAIVMDLYSRRIIGWSMRNKVDQTLTQDALGMALQQRQPKQSLLHHSDQGAEYTNHAYQSLVKEHNMIVSLSRRGECHDNAVAESFFKSIKVELVKQQKFKDPEEARSAIFEYIEIFYNRKRLHSTLGYISPADYERLNPVN